MISLQTQMEGLPKPDKQGYASIAEMMHDNECPIDKKLKLIGRIRNWETYNGVSRDDMFAMMCVTYDLLKTQI